MQRDAKFRVRSLLYIFFSVLPSSDLETMLSDTSGHHTVLAPNDDAFSKVDSETLKKWQNGEACVGSEYSDVRSSPGLYSVSY